MLRVYTRLAAQAGCRLSAVTADVTRRCPRGAGGCTRPGTAVPHVRHEERGGAGRRPRQASRGEGAARWGFVGRGHRQLWRGGGKSSRHGHCRLGDQAPRTRSAVLAAGAAPCPRPCGPGPSSPSPLGHEPRTGNQVCLPKPLWNVTRTPARPAPTRRGAAGPTRPAHQCRPPPPILVPERRSGSSCAGAPTVMGEFLP